MPKLNLVCPICQTPYTNDACNIHKTCSGKCGREYRRRVTVPATFNNRFWSKVDKSGGPDACWEWTSSRNKLGYGTFCVDGKCQLAHRVAMQVSGIELGKDDLACHSCDNPPCCNLRHLWKGTDMDNSRDKMAKGRGNQAKGEKCHLSKLTEPRVLEIREKLKSPHTIKGLARAYGVDRTAIKFIRDGKSWKHLLPR